MCDKKERIARLLNVTCTHLSKALKDVCKTIKCKMRLRAESLRFVEGELRKEILVEEHPACIHLSSLDASFMSSK